MKKKIYLHERKYLFSRQEIFIYVKIIRQQPQIRNLFQCNTSVNSAKSFFKNTC